MVIILKAKVKEQCDEKNSYIRECEKLERTEWDLTAYMYKYEKEETIEKLLKLTDKYQNIYINSSVLDRKSVVREEEGSKHTYFNHYDPVTNELVLQIKKYKNPKHQVVGDDKPKYYTMNVGYTEYMKELKPFLKTKFTKKDLGCVKSATSMFEFEKAPIVEEKKVKSKKVKKVVIDDDPILPNEPQFNSVTKKIEKPKKVKKIMIDDDPILPNEPQFNPVTRKIEKVKKVKKVMIDDDPILPNEPQFNPVPKKSPSLKQQIKELHKTIEERVVKQFELIMKNYNDYDEVESLNDCELTQGHAFYENSRNIRMNGVINDNNGDIYWELLEELEDWDDITLTRKLREYMLKRLDKDVGNLDYFNDERFNNDGILVYYYASDIWGRDVVSEEYFINLVKNYICDDGLPYVLK